MPPIVDQLNTSVSTVVQANSQFFAYNNKTNLLSQLNFFAKPTNMTIKVTLTDLLNSVGIYQMLVEFGCK